MPAKQISVNLLNKDVRDSPWNRLVIWISTYGRYIMITTELIVLLAFASRFSLDRKLSDLKENIMQKQEMLEVNAPLEQEIRGVQTKISSIKSIMQTETAPIDTLLLIQRLVPSGTYLESLKIDKEKISSNVIAQTTESFSQFLANLSGANELSNVEISKVGKQTTGFQFTVTATIKNTDAKQTQP